VNKAALIEVIARQTGNSKAAAARSVDVVLAGMKEGLNQSGSLTLSGFGSFEIRQRKSRNGTHPRTHQPIVIGPRKVVVFKAAGRLLK
jgi:DNA-binding protein HU-beta